MGWLRAVRWPAFRRVWVVATLLQFGYWFSSISFQWLVARETNSDPLSLSLLYFCMLLPMLLLSLPAGVLADVRDRRRIMLVAQLAIVMISAVTTTLVATHRATAVVLMGCAFAAGAVHALAIPASQALVANSVPTQDLRSAVLVQSAGMNLARIVGPAVAGLLILYWGATESLLAYGGVGLATMAGLYGLRRLTAHPVPSAPQRMWTSILSGVRHVREHPPAGTALVTVAATSLFGLSYYAQLPAVAARVSPDPSVFLMLATLGALGSVGGVLIVAVQRTGPPRVTPAAVMLAVQGFVVIGLAFSRWLWLALPLVIVGGAMQFGIMTHCNTVIQAVIDDDHRGRVMSLYVSCWGGLLPIGGLLLGTTWHLAGPVVALAASGTAALVVAVIVLRPALVRGRAKLIPVQPIAVPVVGPAPGPPRSRS